jgi:hypothetical protein
MIAVAVLAPLFAAFAALRNLNRALEEFYGPRGKLALEQQISSQLSAGSACLIEASYIEAEARYRSALGLNEELERLGSRTDYRTSRILMGLADSLVGQHRYSEAENLLEQRDPLRSKIDDPSTVEELLARAKSIRSKPAQ